MRAAHRSVQLASDSKSPAASAAPRLQVADSPFVRFKPAPSPKPAAANVTFNVENVGQQQQPAQPPPPKPGQHHYSKPVAARAGKRSALRPSASLAKGRSSAAALAHMKELEAAMRELEDRGEEWGDDGWSMAKELAHTRELATKVKSPTPPQLSNKLNVFIGGGLPAPATAPKSLAAPDWEALPAGTRLMVWWAGNEEYFECTIKDWHVAVGENGSLFYTHRCEYESGTFDHDLSKASFEVIEVAQASVTTPRRLAGLTPRGDARQPVAPGAMTPARSDEEDAKLSPRRRWLMRQEKKLQHFSEELEQADIGTPLDAEAAGRLRGRLAMRWIRQPGLDTPKTPRTPRRAAEDGASVSIVDPSDVAVTYRLPAHTTPVGGSKYGQVFRL